MSAEQCQCVNPNHPGGRCTNTTEMHHFCGGCQSEGAIRMKTTDGERFDAWWSEHASSPYATDAEYKLCRALFESERARVRETAARIEAEITQAFRADKPYAPNLSQILALVKELRNE